MPGPSATSCAASDPDVPELLSDISSGTDAEPVLQLGDAFFATAVSSGDEGIPVALVRSAAAGDAARQRVSIGGQPRLVIGIPLADSDAVYYEVFSLGELEHTLSTLRWSLLAAASFTTVLGALIGAYASRQVLRPLRGFAAGAAQIAEGHLDTRLQAPGDADLAPLATSFNDMAETLQHRVERETRFASDVTHELRTPLTAMSAAVDVMDRRSDERTRQAVDVLRNQVRHFERLVLDLLEISRFDLGAAELTLETVAPAEFATSVLRSLEREDVPLRIERSAPALFRLDKVRVERILANLLDNADRYAGGTTAIELSGHDECLQIAVEDAGPGRPRRGTGRHLRALPSFARSHQRRRPGHRARARARRGARGIARGPGLGRGSRRRWGPIRRRTRKRALVKSRTLAGITVALLCIGACGIPTDDDACRIDPEELPPGLLDATAPTTVAGGIDPLATTEVVAIYLVRNGALAPSLAEVARGASLNEVLARIRVAPDEELAEEGFRSALVSDVPVVQSIALRAASPTSTSAPRSSSSRRPIRCSRSASSCSPRPRGRV